MKKIYFLIPIFIIALSRFCHHQTDGFKISKITGNTSPLIHSLPTLNSDPALFDQKFTFLGRGIQSFSFLSEDKTTVLKIMNNRYQKRIFWFQFLPGNWSKEKVQLAKMKLARNFTSYQIAYEELKEETGLLYFHPSETNFFNRKATLVDKIGIAHEIDLDKTAFVLQKKAQLVYPHLNELMEKNDLIKAKQAIFDLVQLLLKRYEKGIADNDQLMRTNFGFVLDDPMQIDVGPFSKNPAMKDPKESKKQLRSATMSLKHWLENHYPELAIHLDEILKNN